MAKSQNIQKVPKIENFGKIKKKLWNVTNFFKNLPKEMAGNWKNDENLEKMVKSWRIKGYQNWQKGGNWNSKIQEKMLKSLWKRVKNWQKKRKNSKSEKKKILRK